MMRPTIAASYGEFYFLLSLPVGRHSIIKLNKAYNNAWILQHRIRKGTSNRDQSGCLEFGQQTVLTDRQLPKSRPGKTRTVWSWLKRDRSSAFDLFRIRAVSPMLCKSFAFRSCSYHPTRGWPIRVATVVLLCYFMKFPINSKIYVILNKSSCNK